MMRAAIYRSFGGPIRIETVTLPSTPLDGLIVQVMATGVCRSDWHGYKGHDGDVRNHGLPFCPGHELSGIVYKVGEQVCNFSVGDRIAVPFILSCGQCSYCHEGKPTVCSDQQQPGFTQWGSFAEYVALPRADRNVRKIPASVSFVQAAALGCRFTTAYRAVLQQGRLDQKSSNSTVAVFGCGGLGLSCIMIAAATGNAGKIIAIDVSPLALQKAKELGATHTVQAASKENSNVDVQEKVFEITKGHGADLTLDAAGFASTCENAVYCTKRGGRMVQVGLPIGEVKPVVPMGLVAGRELELVGSHGFAAVDLPDLLEMVVSGKLDPGKLVEKEVTLEEGARAIEDMDNGSPLGMTIVTKFQRGSSL
ncbi:L-threonine 3-dehydrogenase [Seminavis robusta]|uniref:L-threonine 3-dehydrogenase n=1 Tax=Seminavis robusta TaxID=568900 RepID=A0A9N8EJP5_9STRA|nr:L-threonine 3-dehydrogenase [Seminavis robusta]|eukprot:Sro1358_g265910.1 L-threonine 3-dehydrogenase (366) ;mRNA; r:26789-27999